MIGGRKCKCLLDLVDSSLETTRVFWRKKYFNATDKEALDHRVWLEVLKDRHNSATI